MALAELDHEYENYVRQTMDISCYVFVMDLEEPSLKITLTNLWWSFSNAVKKSYEFSLLSESARSGLYL